MQFQQIALDALQCLNKLYKEVEEDFLSMGKPSHRERLPWCYFSEPPAVRVREQKALLNIAWELRNRFFFITRLLLETGHVLTYNGALLVLLQLRADRQKHL